MNLLVRGSRRRSGRVPNELHVYSGPTVHAYFTGAEARRSVQDFAHPFAAFFEGAGGDQVGANADESELAAPAKGLESAVHGELNVEFVEAQPERKASGKAQPSGNLPAQRKLAAMTQAWL